MSRSRFSFPNASRRDLLKAAMYGIGVSAASRPSPLFAQAAAALEAQGSNNGKILVVLELTGGNDGLNTLIPWADDAYYKHRPKLGIPAGEVLKIDDHFGFSGGMVGFQKLYKDGKIAIVHGCGYDNPSFSHFTSMAYWQTAAPNSGEEYGWFGRLADRIDPSITPNFLVNIGSSQSLAVRSRLHTPVVFDDPNRFSQEKFAEEVPVLDAPFTTTKVDNPTRQYLIDAARSARDASALVRTAWSKYHSPIDYGIVPLDLPKVAALIEAKMPSRLYYTSFRNNAFDTHVFQGDLHKRLLTYASDSVAAFMKDMERIGRADDVVVMMFSEFGRRVPENVNLGTDHGTANLMFVVGKPVKGGHYGTPSSLTKLDAGDNLIYSTDFRRVYATMISGWLGLKDSKSVLKGEFETFPLFREHQA
jgi:uncharacterized protein (DUF1501 family)